MDRRTFLKATLALAAAGPALAQPQSAAARRLAPVNVDPARVIRTLVGLRPFRRNGFRVERETFADRTLVHNYGHGGSGITLSWGTSQQAVDLAWSGPERDYAVLGCGVMGLSTARLLQERGGRVTIYARDLPPHTTSNVAGGQWAPAVVADKKRRTPAWDAQFQSALQLSRRAFQDYLGDLYGIRWLENYYPSKDAPGHDREDNADYHLYLPEESPWAGYYARRLQTMMIEPALYLNRLMHDVLDFGGRLVVRSFASRASLLELEETVLLNCTGLGSRELFDDAELMPVRGQLCVLLPQPEIDYAYVGDEGYMFPRRDGIVLGGTYERGNFSLEADPAATARILAEHARFQRALR